MPITADELAAAVEALEDTERRIDSVLSAKDAHIASLERELAMEKSLRSLAEAQLARVQEQR